jgi:hypothetical protein
MSVFDLRKASAVVAIGVLAGAACGGSAPPPSSAPDVTGLIDAYKAPRGTVDMARAPAWLDAAQSQLDLVAEGNSGSLLSAMLAAANRQIDAAALPNGHDGPIPTRTDGLLTIEIPCGDTSDETATVVLQIVDGKIAPLLWGSARRCGFGAGGGLASYDGTFAVYRYPTTHEQLVRVDGVMGGSVLGDGPSPLTLDFRSAAGKIETRVPTSSGDVIVTRTGSQIVARAANGKFRCSVYARACTAMPK